MKTIARLAFDAYCTHLAQINGVPLATQSFAVAPTVEQTLEEKIQESAAFLQLINIVSVDQQSAQILGLGPTGPTAGRTDTDAQDRAPRDIMGLSGRSYTCSQTNFDTFIKYATLDQWAKFKDFQARWVKMVTGQIARDRLMIGFNGTSIAATTDIAANPLLQDVNKGWLQHIREDKPENVMFAPKIGTAADADYRNLDSLVEDAIGANMAEWYQDDTDLVCITGRSLINDKYLALMDSADTDKPTEKAALSNMYLNKVFGTHKAMRVPFFPATSMLITRPDNLSIYWQDGTRRRTITDNAKRDRIEDYQSVNEAYVVEDYDCCVLIEGIVKSNA